jgi:ribonuclease Z
MYGAAEDLPKARENRHMLFAEAAAIAREAAVDALWLTHFSPSLTAPAEYLPMARAIFANTYLGATGLTTTLSFPK